MNCFLFGRKCGHCVFVVSEAECRYFCRAHNGSTQCAILLGSSMAFVVFISRMNEKSNLGLARRLRRQR